MKNIARYATIAVLFVCVNAVSVMAHCQIPCGIYDDQMRIHMMEEHVTTIAKSMSELSTEQSQNQAVRWVMNKEQHADALSEIVIEYFLVQRIKPGMDHYEENLKTLHEILIYSMKAKQTTDQANVKKLNELIHNFEHTYMGEKHQH